MAGGIQPGTCATSPSSVKSESRHRRLVREVVNEFGPRWCLAEDISVEERLGYLGEYSKQQNGESQRNKADGGILCLDNKKVAVFENKWQSARANAIQRACFWNMYFPYNRIFLSCEGPGFKKKDGGGSTGPFIDLWRHNGGTLLENEMNDDKYKDEVRNFILKIKEEMGI